MVLGAPQKNHLELTLLLKTRESQEMVQMMDLQNLVEL